MEHYYKVLGAFFVGRAYSRVCEVNTGRDYSVAQAVHVCYTVDTHFKALGYVAVNFWFNSI